VALFSRTNYRPCGLLFHEKLTLVVLNLCTLFYKLPSPVATVLAVVLVQTVMADVGGGLRDCDVTTTFRLAKPVFSLLFPIGSAFENSRCCFAG
jgi:hypothetical protein